MKHVPGYAKVLTLGSAYTENALMGEVILQEKVDGSQFGFGINEDGELVFRSHNQAIDYEAPNKMFSKVVDYLKSIEGKIKAYPKDTYFYCEYLSKPKHNTLCYDETPLNNLVLFDVQAPDGRWADRKYIENIARYLEIDAIPELYRGIANAETITNLLATPSYLGNEIIEGIVIKNYNQTVLLNGKILPLITKFVRPEFKEKHQCDWKIRSPKTCLADYVNSFCCEPRWQKAIIHAKEQGNLSQSPKDIGMLIKMIQEDVLEEETEDIKQRLFDFFKDDILSKAIKGFPQWYKEELLKNLN